MTRVWRWLFGCHHRVVLYDRTAAGAPCWRCYQCGRVKVRSC